MRPSRGHASVAPFFPLLPPHLPLAIMGTREAPITAHGEAFWATRLGSSSGPDTLSLRDHDPEAGPLSASVSLVRGNKDGTSFLGSSRAVEECAHTRHRFPRSVEALALRSLCPIAGPRMEVG